MEYPSRKQPNNALQRPLYRFVIVAFASQSATGRCPLLLEAQVAPPWRRYTGVILRAMKTAVSIPDRVFKAADKLARRLGLSRSGLYAEAVQRFVLLHDENAITNKLNEILTGEPVALDPRLQSIQARSISSESWK